MYLYEQGTIEELKEDTFFKLNKVPEDKVNVADRYEIWASSFEDLGEDFNELVLFKNDVEIFRRRNAGY